MSSNFLQTVLATLLLCSVPNAGRCEEDRVSFSLITDTILECDQGLIRTGINATLQQRLLSRNLSEIVSWKTIGFAHIAALESPSEKTVMKNFTFNFTSLLEGRRAEEFLLQLRLLQWEHGGGYCNCWGVVNNSWLVEVNGSELLLNYLVCSTMGAVPNSDLQFCSGSASVPRGFLSPMLESSPTASPSSQELCNKKISVLEHAGNPLQQRSCSNSSKIVVRFRLDFPSTYGCDAPEGVDKGVEFSILGGDSHWIPLAYYHLNYSRRPEISIGQFSRLLPGSSYTVGIRGYDVPAHNILNNTLLVSIEICDPTYLGHSHAQFRWLETSRHPVGNTVPVDVWGLDDVTIVQVTGDSEQRLVDDNFDTQEMLNTSVWMSLRNGLLRDLGSCRIEKEGQQLLFFSASPEDKVGSSNRIVSRLVTTVPLPLVSAAPTSTHPPGIPTTPTQEATTPPETETEEQLILRAIIDDIENMTAEDEVLREILEERNVNVAVNRLLNETSSGGNLSNSLLAVYALGQIVSTALDIFSAPSPTRPPPSPDVPPPTTPPPGELEEIVDEFTQALLEVGSNIIAMEIESVGSVQSDIIGSSLLVIMETVAFTLFRFDEGSVAGRHIEFMARREGPSPPFRNGSGREPAQPVAFTPRPEYALKVPREQLERFPDESQDENGETRVVSFLFTNISRFFPGFLPNTTSKQRLSSSLASSILSTSLQCGQAACRTNVADSAFTENVTITILHSQEVQDSMNNSTMESNVSCAFWNFITVESFLSFGEWSDEGCWRNETASNASVTVCECNHLTHFAILLSAKPITTMNQAVTLSLQAIGYVGVAVSLVAMTLTVLVFTMLKALHTMRNYIHIQLCVTLGIAQLLFVTGADRASGESGRVPIPCQAIAVLLHYFFLVSFMWMLMEGVVLYVVLVKVFVKRKRLYMLGFTLVSYGLPLLYMGLLTLPIGYALPAVAPSYGYASSCFLNPGTGFIWAFIAPVVVILLANTGFFIMAATIMWRHQKKQSDLKRAQQLKHWLKAAVSLVVIMGVTWLLGVLVVAVEALLPLAYIFTILVAFQGLFIFIIFVCLSKSVREAYGKWWRVKVSESDTLSKYFGEKLTLTSSVSKPATSKQGEKTLPHPDDSLHKTLPLPTQALSTNSTANLKTTPLPLPLPTRALSTDSTADLETMPLPPPPSMAVTSPVVLGTLEEVPIITNVEEEGPGGKPRPRSRHWSTLRRKMEEGTLFKVIFSPTYFSGNSDHNDTLNSEPFLTLDDSGTNEWTHSRDDHYQETVPTPGSDSHERT